jgi:hypothetical protein
MLRKVDTMPSQFVSVLATVLFSGIAASDVFSQSLPSGTVETTSHIDGSTGYPRVVRILNEAGAKGDLVASSRETIFSSTDHGHHWHTVSTIDSKSNGLTFRCCETLFQLSRAVGRLKQGTLIYSAAYFKGTTPAIGYYFSTDHGHTWVFQGVPVSRGKSSHRGLWEPQFEIANDGALVMFWSDETDSAHSQKLAQIRNYFTGAGWQDETDTVASDLHSDRPGMAVVSQLSNGHFIMTYEVQGPAHKGAVHARISSDGWSFGDPSKLGFRPTDEQGEYFKVAPSNVWIGEPVHPSGAIFLVGRNLVQSNGQPAQLDGQVLFQNSDPDGRGVWRRVPAPVPVQGIPTSSNINCANYSSVLLGYPDGRGIVELATKADSPNAVFGKGCSIYVGHLPFPLHELGR